MVQQISNYGDYIVSIDKDMYCNNRTGDIVELQLAIGKRELKRYKIMAMYRKDDVGYFRVKDCDEFIKSKEE